MLFEETVKKLPFDLNPANTYLHIDDNNIDSIKKRLFDIDNISDEDLYNLIRRSYSYILDEIFIAKNLDLIKFLYTNKRFIMIFNNVLSRPDIQLSYLQTVYCNKLAYDYFTARGTKDDYIRSLLENLTKTVNRAVIPGLIGMGLSEELALYLANARYSSLKEEIQVKRLNLEIMKQKSEIITVQRIVDIYGKLFDRITPLFNGIMYDYWPADQFASRDMEDIYATINIAILEIVNNLPADIRYHLLKNFYETYQLLNVNKFLRFNIYSFCADDYPYLNASLESLRHEGIILPMK